MFAHTPNQAPDAEEMRTIEWERPILVGSPPSTGSTLLSVMLDAHPEILCGPELNIFSHPSFWSLEGAAWRESISRAIHYDPSVSSQARCERGHTPFSLVPDAKNLAWYGLSLESLRDHIARSSNGRELVERVYAGPLQRRGKVRWAEKSPPNLYAILQWATASG